MIGGPVYGTVAVWVFFILAGFFAAMTLNEREKYKGYKNYLFTRILRIYPTYYLVLFLTLLFGISAYMSHFPNIKSFVSILVFQLPLVGLDNCLNLNLTSKGSLVFTGTWENSLLYWGYILVPQAWMLGIIMSFYIVAPFLVRRSIRFQLALVAFGIGSEVLLSSIGFNPYLILRLPNVLLAYFLAGSLAYQLFLRMRPIKLHPGISFLVIISVFLLTIFYDHLPMGPLKQVHPSHLKLYYFLIITLSLPFMMRMPIRFDRQLTAISYPMYLIHILVAARLFPITTTNIAITTTIISFIISIFVIYLLSPMERIRRSI
jgi:peptidoglycan/LPS O-acetylase OafA/YrhL